MKDKDKIDLKGQPEYDPAETAMDEVIDSLSYLDGQMYSIMYETARRMRRRWAYAENNCINSNGHKWETLENIVADNGVEVWGKEKCSKCGLVREFGVKP